MTLDTLLDWGLLTFGRYSLEEIKRAVASPAWQTVRRGLKGLSLEEKYVILTKWYETTKHSDDAKIQITNYVNALRRAGMVKANETK